MRAEKTIENNFDLLRLLAASQVLQAHALEHLHVGSVFPPWLGHLLSIFPGVVIFFVISGFLISMSWERHPQVRRYARNRLLRIYPGLWVCFAVSFLGVLVLWGPSPFLSNLRATLAWIVAQLTFAQFYNPDFLRSFGTGVVNGSLWTIPVEMQFYVALPVVYVLGGFLRRKSNGALVALIALFAFLSRTFVAYAPDFSDRLAYKLVGVSFVPYFFMFLVGVFLQRNFERLRPWIVGRAGAWLAVYLVSSWIVERFGWDVATNLPNVASLLILAVTVISFAHTGTTWSRRLLKDNDISYGVYLYHMVVINLMVALGYVGRPVFALVAGVTVYGLAFFSWQFVEKPCLRLKTTRTQS